MNAHLRYLSYVVRHKWFVLLAGLRTGAPLWRLVIHDWSKFTPSEWLPYVDYFYRGGGVAAHASKGGRYDPADGPVAFNVAWLRHQHRNPHHWQHWILREDDGGTLALRMPEHFAREMVADWMGAGRAQGHGDDVRQWFATNSHRIVLHPATRRLVEILVNDGYEADNFERQVGIPQGGGER